MRNKLVSNRVVTGWGVGSSLRFMLQACWCPARPSLRRAHAAPLPHSSLSSAGGSEEEQVTTNSLFVLLPSIMLPIDKTSYTAAAALAPAPSSAQRRPSMNKRWCRRSTPAPAGTAAPPLGAQLPPAAAGARSSSAEN